MPNVLYIPFSNHIAYSIPSELQANTLVSHEMIAFVVFVSTVRVIQTHLVCSLKSRMSIFLNYKSSLFH